MTTQRQLRKRKREPTTHRIWRALNIFYAEEGCTKEIILQRNGDKPSYFHNYHFVRHEKKYMPLVWYARQIKIKDPYAQEMGWMH